MGVLFQWYVVAFDHHQPQSLIDAAARSLFVLNFLKSKSKRRRLSSPDPVSL
jgi:hypothetical protein